MICHASQNGLKSVWRSCGVADCASGDRVGDVANGPLASGMIFALGSRCPVINPPEKPPASSANPMRTNRITCNVLVTTCLLASGWVKTSCDTCKRPRPGYAFLEELCCLAGPTRHFSGRFGSQHNITGLKDN